MPPRGRRFKKGESGNPGGRPKVAEIFREAARKAAAKGGKDGELLVAAWKAEVLKKGDDWVECSKLLASYGYGKPLQPVELSGPDGEPLKLEQTAMSPGELLAEIMRTRGK